MSEYLLRAVDISKSFGAVHALQGVTLEIKPGEVHCLAGENGCGKSTIIKVICGVHKPDGGHIEFDGKSYTEITPLEAINMGVQVIYQDFAVFPNLSVAENIAMNRALMTGAKRMDWKLARKLAIEAMEQIGANMDPDTPVERLSVANKQMVAICRAIINDAKLLILDEPTTALTAHEVEKLNTIVRNLKAKGMAIVIVNHKLDEIYKIADRLTILRNGENVATGLISEFDRARFVKCMTGREVSDDTYRPAHCDTEILKVEHLTRKGAFEDISFTLKKGDMLGITGLLGSGRGEIGDALFGLAPAESGSITLNGKQIRIKSIRDAMKNKIGYVPEDRLTQGLFMTRSIQDNTVAASIARYLKRGKLDYSAMYQVTEDWIKTIGCAAPSPVGVDVGSKADIHKILHELVEKGIGVIIISDDLGELVKNCNKLIIMKNGKTSGMIETGDMDENQLTGLLNSGM